MELSAFNKLEEPNEAGGVCFDVFNWSAWLEGAGKH